MNNNYNNFNNFYPYGNYMRNVPANYATSFRAVPNYMYNAPALTRNTGSLLSRLFPSAAGSAGTSAASGVAATSGFSFSGLLNGASKTLGVINQAIPVFYQIKPIWNNAKTMFRVAKAMNEPDSSNSRIVKEVKNDVKTNKTSSNNNEPTFFN